MAAVSDRRKSIGDEILAKMKLVLVRVSERLPLTQGEIHIRA